MLGRRQSSLCPRWLLLHPGGPHPWLQMPTGTSGHGRWVHTYRGHWSHLRHLVLDRPLKNLHVRHLALCLSCPLNLHCHFHCCRWGPWKGWLSSLRRGWRGYLACCLTLGHRASSLSPGQVGRHAIGRCGLGLRRRWGLRCLWGGGLLAGRRGRRGRRGGGQTLLLPRHAGPLHAGHSPPQHLRLLQPVLQLLLPELLLDV